VTNHIQIHIETENTKAHTFYSNETEVASYATLSSVIQ